MKSNTSTLGVVAVLSKITCVAMIAGTSLVSFTALGQPERNDQETLTVAQLKTVYLDCNRRAVHGLLATGEITACSVIYEQLKKRAFGGDFEKLLAWSQAQAPVKSAAR